jgi:hypothetical protein
MTFMLCCGVGLVIQAYTEYDRYCKAWGLWN